MRTELTQQEIAFYRNNGFLAVPDLLSAAELETWRAAVDAAVESRGAARFASRTLLDDRLDGEPGQDKAADFYRTVFVQRVNLWQSSEQVRELMFDPGLGRLVADLAGVGGIRIWHDQALLKQPYASFTAYHLDVPNWSFTSPDAISIWVALDDATVENGCLYYLPGTHKARKYDTTPIDERLGGLFDVYPDWKDIAPVPCPVPAGGACFHNGLTAHGAGANMTHGWRRAMTCAYMPDGSTFNGIPNVLPPAYHESLEIGDLLDNETVNPLIYAR